MGTVVTDRGRMDKEEQDDELMALTSIYDESVLSITQEDGENGGQFLASLQLPDPFYIHMDLNRNKEDNMSKKDSDLHMIKYLPEIVLNFQLPSDYPSCHSPHFTLSCKWLNRQELSSLCRKLDKIWHENEQNVILFMWFSFLSEETFDFLKLKSPLQLSNVISHRKEKSLAYDKRGIQDIASQDCLLPAILDFDKQAREQEFNRTIFCCKVCFNEKIGARCLNFSGCDHVYCKECMKDYFRIQIDDGNVKSLYCPEEKCESQAHPSQIKQLVSEEHFIKYDRLLLQSSLDMMADIMYCPRPSCQYPVLLEKESNMGTCPACFYVFCTLCKLVYHGLSPCRIRAEGLRKLRDEYLAADSATQEFLEKRYGKNTIHQALEETFSNEWLEQFSKCCPGCGCHIQKIDGCNKMTCMKCRTYFCWICMELLARNNPYRHFNTPGNDCFNKLFEGEEFDEDGLLFDDDDDDLNDAGIIFL
ncbi:hypothetical protein ScPMuIL_011267 [Solemya velum]